jgi:hypothetical protein
MYRVFAVVILSTIPFLLLISGKTAQPAAARGLRVGAAKREITPPFPSDKPIFLGGFGMNRTATGVHDDLWARAIAFSDGGNTVAICSVDLVGFMRPDLLKVREAVRQRVRGNVHVIVAATHNHNAPDSIGIWGPNQLTNGVDAQYLDMVRKQVIESVVEAVQQMKPATLTFAQDEPNDLADLQGDDRIPLAKDPMVRAVQAVDKATRKTIGTLVQWSDHPETFGGENRLVTSDFCHFLRERVEEKLGGMAVYVNGAVGGMMTTLGVNITDPQTGQPAPQRSWRKCELIGLRIADVAIAALGKGETVDNANVRVKTKDVFIPLQNERFRLAVGLKVLPSRPLYLDGKPNNETRETNVPGVGKVNLPVGNDMLTEVNLVTIGPAQIITIPGEIYPELVNGGITRYPGADFPDAPFEPVIRESMKAKYKFVLGLANDELGYIIPQCEWDEKEPWLNNASRRPYGEVNSCGWKAARIICEAAVELLR